MKRTDRLVTATVAVTRATAFAVRLATAILAVAVLALLSAPAVWAVPGNFALQCAGCHTDDTPTCNGCHIHVINQLGAQTDKTDYSPGETVTVTLNLQGTPLGGGWLRAVLYDETMTEVDRVTGPTFTGDDGTGDPTLQLPVALSASAPLAAGVYQWAVGWFGHSGTPGVGYSGHGELELVDTNFFSVGGATTTTTTVPGGTTTTTTTILGTTTTTIPGGTTTTTLPGATTTTTTVATTTTTTTLPPKTGLDHFLCYKNSPVRATVNVGLSDQFDTGQYEGLKSRLFCAPADKENEGVADPETHLMSFRIKGPHQRLTNVEVTNQFGTFLFDTIKTMTLLVPSAKSLVPDPGPGQPDPASEVDHYRCVKVRPARGADKFPRGLTKQISDQFGDRTVTIKKPYTLCVPTNKNGEGIKDADAHLMCYKVKTTTKTSASGVQANNQLLGQPAAFSLRREAELCVPSIKGGVDVSADVSGDSVPGAALSATASIHIGNGSTLQSIEWTVETEVPGVTLDGADTANATVTLPARSVYKDRLISLLSEPPIGEDQLPPNIPLPEGEFPGGLQDRFQVVGVNPFALEETGPVSLHLAVTTTSGTYTDEVDLHTELPFKTASGLLNVPVGIPVILHGKDGVAPPYDWALSAPGSSSAALNDPTLQNPDFTPDVAGEYGVTVTDTSVDPPEVVTIEIHAGTWSGGITGQDANGRPIAGACTGCHNGSFAPDMFTDWKETGHAEIFTNNLNTSTHYGSSCFPCHSVGYDPDVNNGGMDDAPDYAAFLAAGLLNNPGDNWTTVLADFPNTAKRANIQCENCHGPQNSTAHAAYDPRMSISSDVCGVCHGEPLRHARFQQWQLSAHANFEVAIDESQSGSCSRCHTGNGFIAWMDVGNDPDTNVTVTWTEDEAQPQTCATCHDPHNIGTVSGNNTNATVRISDDTPPLSSGFTATDVGRGALCMTCHNSRRGLRNDSVWDAEIAGTSEAARSSHGGPQADIVMGENLYLVTVPARGPHSLTGNVPDTCVTCHMEATPPPADLAYNQGGTNHTFYARPDICGECHGFDSAQGVQNPVEAKLHDLEEAIEAAILQLMADQITAGNVIDLNGDGAADITDVSLVQEIAFGEYHGRQAITVTFTDLTTVGPRSLSDVDVLDGGTLACPAPLTRCELYDFADDSLPKAGWNYTVVHNDGSKGVHNPGLVFDVLDTSIAALTP